MRWVGLILSVGLGALLLPSIAKAQPADSFTYSGNDYGGVGLLQTRTARFGRDGQLDVGYAKALPYERYLINLQPLPWIEATFRYTSVVNRDFQGNFFDGAGTSFKDRGADLKFLLVREGRLMPQLAVGIQDGLGTGLFAGEYLVASKKYYDLDFSLGMGWGYSGGSGGLKNPLASLSDSFKKRGSAAGTQGGRFIPSSWFSGPNVGLFGGVEYFTPLKGLSIKLEYDPNDYNPDPLENRIPATSHFNFGANFRAFQWIDIGAGFERGNQFTFRVSLRANLNDPGIPKTDPPAPPLTVRPPSFALPVVGTSARAEQVPFARKVDPILASRMIEFSTPDDGLLAALLEEGLPVERVRNQGSVLQVDLASNLYATRSVARLIALYTESEAETIVVATPNDPGAVFQASALRKRVGIEAFLEDMSLTDLELSEIGLRDGHVTLVLETLPTARQVQAISSGFRLAADSGDELTVLANNAGSTQAVLHTVAAVPAPKPEAAIASTAAQIEPVDRIAIAQRVFEELDEEGIAASGVDVQSRRMTVYLAGRRYREMARNIGRAAVILANNGPPTVEEIAIVLVSAPGPYAQIVLQRRQLESLALGEGSTEEIWIGAEISGAEVQPMTTVLNEDRYPSFDYRIRPALRQHIGSGDRFYLYQLYLSLGAGVELAPGFDVQGLVGVDGYNNFDRLNTISDSVLPRVRSDIREYLQQGENNLIRLQANYMTTLGRDLYARVSAGILEQMYGGYGGELLYRPFGSRLAVGIDLNYVRQRDFDQRLTFRDYSVATGHVNVYYQLPYKNLLAQLNVGQYLAGDRGATFQISRLFDSGVRIGGFATITNVPFNVFGEGSFDKGFFIAIPLDLFSLRSSTNVGIFGFTPLTKDGGQRLTILPRLYDLTGGGNLDSVSRHWDQLLK